MNKNPDRPLNIQTRLPLAIGDAVEDDNGNLRELVGITIAITSHDGTTIHVPLRRDGKQWWAPTAS